MSLDENVQYWVGRDGQTFGPYSAAEVREYLRTGHVVATDYLRGERDTEWTTIAAALGLSAAPPRPMTTAPQASGNSKDFMYAVWGLVLGVLGLFCCGFFTAVPGIFLSRIAMKSTDERSHQLGLVGVIVNVLAIIAAVAGLCVLIPMYNQFTQALDNMQGGMR
ncbi:MAG: DUF4339 domain-containing protein [Phycisphaerae bacterium]|nr:DUF4339 domain-containing protein [Phycisphaerae bacterium]